MLFLLWASKWRGLVHFPWGKSPLIFIPRSAESNPLSKVCVGPKRFCDFSDFRVIERSQMSLFHTLEVSPPFILPIGYKKHVVNVAVSLRQPRLCQLLYRCVCSSRAVMNAPRSSALVEEVWKTLHMPLAMKSNHPRHGANSALPISEETGPVKFSLSFRIPLTGRRKSSTGFFDYFNSS